MPNYVKNAITFKTIEGLERFKKAYMPDGEFSFNSIDEMPASLDIERGGKTLLAFKIYVTKNHIEGVEYPLTLDLTPEKLEEVYSHLSEKEKKDYLRLGEQIVSNLREYGCADWYGGFPIGARNGTRKRFRSTRKPTRSYSRRRGRLRCRS